MHITRLSGQLLALALLGSCCACTARQAPAGGAITVNIPSTGFPALDAFRASRVAVYMDDFGQLSQYSAANASLKPPSPAESRVVFFGDSITENWDIDRTFRGKPYINRGIGGQTTSQMLVRFHQDVIDLQPEVVVILAGTNDIAGNNGPISNQSIEEHLIDLAELARVHGIRVIFASILPVHNYTSSSKEFFAVRPMGRILGLNAWLQAYCATQKLVYLDYFAALVDGSGYLKRNLSDDGVHPNESGYKAMAPLAEKAIYQALQTH